MASVVLDCLLVRDAVSPSTYRPSWLRPFLPFLLEPVHFIMEHKMLRSNARQTRTAEPTGRRRARADAAAPTAGDSDE